ncbi:hypothetical protein HYQ44_009097 [Verticillium longisporum]|nr:hypothetical protein HYQ44_009097 [Verticillium longisporum]
MPALPAHPVPSLGPRLGPSLGDRKQSRPSWRSDDMRRRAAQVLGRSPKGALRLDINRSAGRVSRFYSFELLLLLHMTLPRFR